MITEIDQSVDPLNTVDDPVVTETDYWNSLINESKAADFLFLSPRTLQGLRFTGGGPEFIKISKRCIRYRRVDLKAWADSKIRTSTSDRGGDS